MKFGVKVMPRGEVLDTQGRAVENTLKNHQFPIQAVRVGKFIELDLQGTEAEATAKAQEIAKFVLCNPLIETFEVKKLD